MAAYVADTTGLQIIPPTLTVDDRMTIVRGKRTIDVLYLGRGHSRGDLVVHLPAEGIVVAGDLVVWPVPTVGSTSFPADFATTLGKLRALRPKIIVPGHGPVMHDDSYVQNVERMLISIRDQTAAGVARGETLEQIRKSVALDEFRRLFAGSSKLRTLVFDNYVAGPAVGREFELRTRR